MLLQNNYIDVNINLLLLHFLKFLAWNNPIQADMPLII